jgi:hypothetical protein
VRLLRKPRLLLLNFLLLLSAVANAATAVGWTAWCTRPAHVQIGSAQVRPPEEEWTGCCEPCSRGTRRRRCGRPRPRQDRYKTGQSGLVTSDHIILVPHSISPISTQSCILIGIRVRLGTTTCPTPPPLSSCGGGWPVLWWVGGARHCCAHSRHRYLPPLRRHHTFLPPHLLPLSTRETSSAPRATHNSSARGAAS